MAVLPGLDDAERERYARQMGLDGFGEEGQLRLKGASVLLAGAGGLGSASALYLAAAGVGRLVVVDADTVALSNLNRQVLHTESSLGLPKVISAAGRLGELNSTVRVEPRKTLLGADNAVELLAGIDVAVDGLDNFASRVELNRACLRQSVPLVFGGVRGMRGLLATVLPGRSPCLSCLFPTALPDGSSPILGPAPGVIGALQAAEALKIITGLGVPLAGRLLSVCLLTMRFREIDCNVNSECPDCGILPY